ncbi:hypothetical protein FHS39_002673 [Streptomyces olivoverticillatus]|uniref:Histidine phosphatase family protein n=1 Tax=Streptomyces olivoverticillatus TaxID=66427 RepID=A0A7W7PKW0_9ACTN|nr:hypothetical protein [Streptomyces olivoverticillatus]MBB4893642.1 hypothetical protein [Streptomyces olivoverticillatus]
MTGVHSPSGPGAGRIGRRGVLAGLAAAAPLLLAGCGGHHDKRAQAASPSPSGPAADATIVIIRHGEKPDGDHPGMDESGKRDKKSLTQRGWDRANALPRLFPPASGEPAAGVLPRPAVIFAAADQGPHAGAHRMRQTVTPLAKQLKLEVDTSIAEGQEDKLAAAALAAHRTVLISWEHSRIPDIVKALGAERAPGVPTSWPNRFDLVWVFTRRHGDWSFRSVPQHLLSGDAAA